MDLYYKRTEFPVQKLPLVKKDNPWRRACVDVLISRESSTFINGRARKDILRINYDLYNGIFSEEDFKYVVDPFNVDEGFPAHPQNFNIIKPKIDLLLGEETKRPFNFRVFSTSDDAISEVQEQKKQLLIKTYLDSVTNGEDQQETEQKLKEINDYVQNSYNTAAEVMAYNSLQYLRESLMLDHELMKGFKDGLISGEEVYYCGIINGDPAMERVNPYHFTYDNNPDLEFIEDGEWATRRFLMSPGTIYDRFQSTMDEEDLDKLLKMVGGDSMNRRPSDVNYNSIIYKDKIISDITNDEFFKGQLLPVWHVCWKSFKKIGYLITKDPDTGEEDQEIVDESYKLSDEERGEGTRIEWDWITEVWEGTRIGTDIYLDIMPVQYQYQSLEDPKTSKLPYVGVRYNATNTRNRSTVDLMKPLQYMYIVVWYRLELALARDKGRVINMDITQIPKSMGVGIDKWMHYLTALGINFINPYEEGWDVPGREGGRAAQFNQMSAQDLSMSAVIKDYIQLLEKIEEMAGDASGISRQRQGEIQTSELVGNVQRATVQSSNITEPLFELHNALKRRAYTALLNTAKFAWSENKKKKLTFIADDYVRKFLEIDDDFLYSDFGVFISDSTKENQNLEALRTLIQPAMQNGATLSDAAMMLTTDSISQITRKLKQIEADRAQQAQMQQQQEQQQQQQQAQAQQQIQAETNRIHEEDSIRKAQTAIQVAQIQAQSQSDNKPKEAPLNDDTGIEMLKVQQQSMANQIEAGYKQGDLAETTRSNKANEALKARELEIKNKVAMKPTPKPATKK